MTYRIPVVPLAVSFASRDTRMRWRPLIGPWLCGTRTRGALACVSHHSARMRFRKRLCKASPLGRDAGASSRRSHAGAWERGALPFAQYPKFTESCLSDDSFCEPWQSGRPFPRRESIVVALREKLAISEGPFAFDIDNERTLDIYCQA